MRTQTETLKIHHDARNGIRKHARKESDKGHYEAVGFLAKEPDNDYVHVLVPLHNHASNPTQAFFVEPWEQFQAEQKLKKDGYEIVGVYHSHVKSEALPSMADHSMARPGEVVVIYSVIFNTMKAYREEDENLLPIELEVVGG